MKLLEGGIHGILFVIYANVQHYEQKTLRRPRIRQDDWLSNMKVASPLERKPSQKSVGMGRRSYISIDKSMATCQSLIMAHSIFASQVAMGVHRQL